MIRGRGPEILLASATLLALFLRFPIASHDVEHYVGPDEGEVVENVLEMLKTGDLDHRHPGYPGLHFYLQMVPAEAHLLAARAAGEGSSIAELPRSGFYLAARRLTLLLGLATAPLVFWCGRSFLPPWGSAFAAALVALSPLQFRESAVVSPDLALGFFVTLALGLALRLLDRRRLGGFIAAGASVGLATAIKYTGAFAVVPYLVAWLLGEAPRAATRRALGGLAAAAVTFAIASPYTFLKPDVFLSGLSMHVGYYSAASDNGAFEILRALFPRGLGVAAGLAGGLGAAQALGRLEPKRLVVLGYPALYLLVFAFFGRAYPRHALVLLPHVALLAADGAGWLVRVPRFAGSRVAVAAALGVFFLLGPLIASAELAGRVARLTPAERASAWVEAQLPPGSRILEDQYTPRLDPERFRVRRLGVEEKAFVGNFDWVLYSGYPPGLDTRGLREARRFERGEALGDTIVMYQVPDRASLMGTTLSDDAATARLGAGELAYFGEGWDEPSPGAFETSRLSEGERSEIFFVLESRPDGPLEAELALGSPVAGFSPRVKVALNGVELARLELGASEREERFVSLPAELLEPRLNRLELRYPRRVRLDRRHRQTAIRFFKLELTRIEVSRR